MTHSVTLSDRAINDLDDLHLWITENADIDTADRYIDRALDRIATLSNFPNRGTPRDEILPRMRTLSFERRLIIAYRVTGDGVLILRVVGGQRDLGTLFEN